MVRMYGAERIGNTIVPSDVESNTVPEAKKLREHTAIFMKQREPLRIEKDDLGAYWDVMMTISTDQADPVGTEIAAIARDEKGTYGMRYTDGTIVPFDPHANRHTVVEGDTFAFGATYRAKNDELSIFGEEGIAGKNGFDLVETLAMFPPEATEAPVQ